MAATTALTGRLGKMSITAVGPALARLTSWSVNPTQASTSEWGDSDTAGYTARVAGRKDCTFDAEGKFDTATEVYDTFQPGDAVVAALWQNATLYWAFPCALCTDFNLSVDVDSEEVIGWTSSWGADGIFYFPGEAGAPVYTL